MRERKQSAAGAPVGASVSARGGRAENQDRCGDTATGFGHVFVVADGLGGHAAGEVAAEAAVGAILHTLRADAKLAPERLRDAFDAAQRAVQEAQHRSEAAYGCRTTAVVLALAGPAALWGHLGDSRLYQLRGGRVLRQTLDHSIPQALVETGVIQPSEIRGHRDRNRLLRSLGGDGDASPTLLEAPQDAEPGDVFLLCTDGFWELLPEAEMEETLAGAPDPAAWLARLEARLLERASGEFDNYSATAVFVGGGGTASTPSRRSRVPAVFLAAIAGLLLGLSIRACIGSRSDGLVFGALAPRHAPAGSPREPGHTWPPAPRLHSPPAAPGTPT
jgi:serine/threonine protein phosphatase PrpC